MTFSGGHTRSKRSCTSYTILVDENVPRNSTISMLSRFGPTFIEHTSLDKLRTDREVLVSGMLSSIGWYIVSCLIFVIIPALSSRSNKKIFVSDNLAVVPYCCSQR